jgi:hypothetical protein
MTMSVGGVHRAKKPKSRIPADEHEVAAAIVENLRDVFGDPLVEIKSGVDRLSRPLITVTVNTRRIAEYSIRIETAHRP